MSLLESDLSIRLFDRDGYRPTLTKKGEEFYKEVKRLSLQYQNVVAHLKEQKKLIYVLVLMVLLNIGE